jgi:hypothetical protein
MDELQSYDEFTKRMEEKFPKMLSGKYGGFAVSSGWWIIIESLMSNIQHYLDWKNRESEVVPQVVVTQIKEKLGGLRFYYDGGNDEIDGMVRMAEAWAENCCETCGNLGKRRSGGWIRTLCDFHENLYQSRKNNE